MRLENHDFPGEGSKNPKEAEIYFELRNGTTKVAYPTFVDGTEINPSGYVDDVNRRAELAKLIIKSEYLGKAIVNRMWAHFLGYGFTKPVDDLGPHNAAIASRIARAARAGIRRPRPRSEAADPLDHAQRAYALSSKIGAEEQARRSDAGREAEVQPLLPAADAGRGAVRIAARGHRGRQDQGQLRAAGKDQGDLARAVHHRLRQRRRGRRHDLQRHDPAGPDDDERRNDQERHEGRAGQLPAQSVDEQHEGRGQRSTCSTWRLWPASRPPMNCSWPTSCWRHAAATAWRPCRTSGGHC